MANQEPIFQTKPKTVCTVMNNASGTALQTLYTAGATDGSLLDNVAVTSDDTSAVILVVTVNDGSTDCKVGEVTIPIGAGTDGTTPAVNLFNTTALPFLQTGGGLPLGVSGVLKVNAKSSITSTKIVNLVAFGGDY